MKTYKESNYVVLRKRKKAQYTQEHNEKETITITILSYMNTKLYNHDYDTSTRDDRLRHDTNKTCVTEKNTYSH